MTEHRLFVLGTLALIMPTSGWLSHATALRQHGTSLLVILLSALVTSLGFRAARYLLQGGDRLHEPRPGGCAGLRLK